MKQNQVRRFSFGELFVHWANAGLYLALFLSGTTLLMGRVFAIPGLAAPWLGKIHRICGVSLVGILLIMFVLSMCLDSFREVWKTLHQCSKWNRHDMIWLARVPINMIYSKCSLPSMGRFNPGQKMHLWVVFCALVGFCVSGSVMILAPGALSAWIVHILCFVPAGMFLGLHLFLSLVNPETRKALPAILTGFISADYVRAHHPLWEVSHQGPGLHGSYVSWKSVSLVGMLVLIGLSITVGLYGFRSFADRFGALVHSSGTTAIAPGPLSARHASVAELQTCRACHSLGQTVQNRACLACHEIIAERRQAQSGFHGTLQGPCRKCHKEHRGAGQSLIDLAAAGFSHEKTLFPLEGKHRELACEQCHPPSQGIAALAGARYVGLGRNCEDCH